MKKDALFLILLSILVIAVWRVSLSNFFAQDDFILINSFSSGSLVDDLKSAFGSPTVTHWRPLHNLYFLAGGKIFGQNYIGYHLLTIFIHILTSFLIYGVSLKIFNSRKVGVLAAFLYAVNPSHFVSLFWISGGSTLIGFFFLIWSFWSYLRGSRLGTLILYIPALLASEAMIAGLVIFPIWKLLINKPKRQAALFLKDRFMVALFGISLTFLAIKFTYLTPKTTFDAYELELSTEIFGAVKYYFLRTLSFGESASQNRATPILIFWLVLVLWGLINYLKSKNYRREILFSGLVITSGFIPFVFLPSHLSAHYMNISMWGFATLAAIGLARQKNSFLLVIIFVTLSLYTISLTVNNNWVTKRSDLAKMYLARIEITSPTPRTTLVFEDNSFSTSKEAYIALGTGEAIDFWFKDKDYNSCFTFIEQCPETALNYF